MRAAVLNAKADGKLDLRDDVETVEPGPDEVLVRVRATGVCHSDLSVIDGRLPTSDDALVVGHEGAGEVLAVGDRVHTVRPGDHVVINWIPSCGRCPECRNNEAHLCMSFMADLFGKPRFRVAGQPAFGMAGTGTWAERLVVPWQAAIPIPDDLPFVHAALFSCGISTGVGAVLNTAQVRPGSSVAVLGLGGVGLSVVQGARIAGATTIVGVDPLPAKHTVARQLGATAVTTPDDLPAVRDAVTGGRGFDYVFEAVGRAATVRQAWEMTRRGGDVVVVGAGAPDDLVGISAYELLFASRNIRPSVYGGCDLNRDLPRLLELYRSGSLDLDSLISAQIRFEELDDAVAALQRGDVLRQIVVFD
ncbi:alcohol dehydrogenase catalytic domain-containing protein [Micromonospora echinofusca]|uniref:Alcohol dehydrogenase catalytic domain-containing protein n=1 Tax=Micromonospora echinofusca TaxID=47858 RepID=A0ABS3VNX9_MICEH|nr:alcohol dehydrogenase catalytic domain-containing protein [Micromonospora echinofusca]MBO4206260.1 alcohol dehydrogenase catalytic domain-containing protein [Micromonospora echinofusca]